MTNEQNKKIDPIQNIKNIVTFEQSKIRVLLDAIKSKRTENQKFIDYIGKKRGEIEDSVNQKNAEKLELESNINSLKSEIMEELKSSSTSTAKSDSIDGVTTTPAAANASESAEQKPVVPKPKEQRTISKTTSPLQDPSVIKVVGEGNNIIRTYVPPQPVKRAPREDRPSNGYQPRTNQTRPPQGNFSKDGVGNFNRDGQNNRSFSDNRPGNPGNRPNISAPVMPSAAFKDNKKKIVEKDKPKIFDDKKNLNRKTLSKKGFLEDTSSTVEYDEISGEIKKIRVRKNGADRRKHSFTPLVINIENAVITTENITVKLLSEKIGKTGAEIIKKLFLLGIPKTINDNIDFDTADLVSSELGIKLELQLQKTSEEKLIESHEDDIADDVESLVKRPPIVTIMGHVDHGKTSILDYIRKANVVSGEAGGITQHIGAYTVSLAGEPITFLDTPGHEAFTSMRARGANVTDIVIIVVAGDDGIMPQTIEAIHHAKAAKVPIIVAVNKMDKPDANPDRVLQQLTEHEILAEDWGGNVPVVKVSAKTGMGIDSLLENILTQAEVMELKANPTRNAKGTIVEARLDKGKGAVATVLVQNGTLKVSDYIVAGTSYGRIRAMIDDKGRPTKKAGPSTPVAILGLQDVPNAGDPIMVVNDEKWAKQVVEERRNKEKTDMIQTSRVTLDDVFNKIAEGKFKDLNLIVKADVQGSSEAIKQSLVKLSNEEVKVNVILSGVGAINENDVKLAETTNAIIIGFNIRPDTNAKHMAESKGIDVRCYRIIYDAIDDVTKAIKGLLAPKFFEEYLGRAEVRSVFKVSSVGSIAGCMVKDGKITRGASVRLLRDNAVIYESTLASLKRFKDDAKEVATGYECGMSITNYNDIKEGDIIEAFVMKQQKAE